MYFYFFQIVVRFRISVALCKGIFNFKPCCVGEIWNSTEGKCILCQSEHFGENCTLLCRVPEYGYRCSSGKCACNRVSCKITIPRECLTSDVSKNASERSAFKPYPSYMTQKIPNATLSKNQTSPDKETNIPYVIILSICGVIFFCAVIVECAIVVRKKICQRDLENDQQIFEPVYSVITIRNE